MRIIQTINDTIRLLFNPKKEVFYLSDFLLVRDVEENFLGQVIEVYDDKFDQEANVAKIKLIYRIVNGNELVPYDNYTPSRECEVAKIKQSEIEKCINLNKSSIIVGKNPNSGENVEINKNFFENNCVIFADKYEQTNKITESLAPKLAKFKNVLILDFSGSCELEGAHAFCAGDNFKLPLSADTIDYIQQKTLLRAKLETQVVLGEIFEEVKNYLESSEDGYLPFSRFIKVVQGQCKETPSVELLVLISWLRKYSRMNIFAKTKKEFEPFFKSVEKNKFTTLDVSNIKTEWQKEFVEYIVNNIQNDVFVLVRLNDNNINNDIINSIYLKKKNVSFIPSFAYGYKKAPYIMEFAQNYILLPTLNPKRDFAHANFQIQALNNESFMLFGDDTKDFIFIMELKSPIKKVKKAYNEENEDKDKLFISLNLQLDEMTPLELHPNNFELKRFEGGKRKNQEELMLSDVLKAANKKADEAEEEIEEEDLEPEVQSQGFEDTSLVSMEDENVLGEDELDYFEQPIEEEAALKIEENISKAEQEETSEEEIIEEETEEIEEPEEDLEGTEDLEEPEIIEEPEISDEIEENKEAEEIVEAEIISEEDESELETIEVEEIEAEIIKQAKKEEEDKALMPKIKEPQKEEEHEDDEEEEIEIAETSSKKNELLELAKENKEDDDGQIDVEEEKEPENEIDENILDAIDEVNGVSVEVKEEPAIETTTVEDIVKEQIEKTKKAPKAKAKEEIKEEPEKEQEEESKEEDKEEETEDKKPKEDKKAEKSEEEKEIDKKFDEILSEENEAETKKEMLQVDEKNSIDLEKIKEEIKKPEHKLPVFDDNEKDASGLPANNFKEGDKVSHESYGTGDILKVIKYGQRCLLQIEFPEVGKRLLDPKIAKLSIVKED